MACCLASEQFQAKQRPAPPGRAARLLSREQLSAPDFRFVVTTPLRDINLMVDEWVSCAIGPVASVPRRRRGKSIWTIRLLEPKGGMNFSVELDRR
jgi:hypothetical protein